MRLPFSYKKTQKGTENYDENNRKKTGSTKKPGENFKENDGLSEESRADEMCIRDSFYCSDRNCAFTLWKNDKFLASQGKKMDKAAAKKFLSKGCLLYTSRCV